MFYPSWTSQVLLARITVHRLPKSDAGLVVSTSSFKPGTCSTTQDTYPLSQSRRQAIVGGEKQTVYLEESRADRLPLAGHQNCFFHRRQRETEFQQLSICLAPQFSPFFPHSLAGPPLHLLNIPPTHTLPPPFLFGPSCISSTVSLEK